MAKGTTWTYKPKGPPLRIRVDHLLRLAGVREAGRRLVAAAVSEGEGQALALHLLLQVPRSEGLAPP